jgi:phosphatidylglycerophosphatase C
VNSALALFDFDGTITRRDTLLDFMLYVKGYPSAAGISVCLIPWLIAFKMKRISSQTFKERFLTLSFRGFSEETLRRKGREYAVRIPGLIRPGALERLDWHRQQGHRIVIVSASTDVWLAEWCRNQDIELICSAMEFIDGVCTGRLSGDNCRGPEKVRRIREELDPDSYAKIYAYGDSSGDTEMLAFAHEGAYRPFH